MHDRRQGSDEIRLTPQEEEGLASLRRERAPRTALEERVVGALKEERLIRTEPTLEASASRTGRRADRFLLARPLPAWGALAAGFVLFLTGGWIGHGVGARTATETLLAVREQDAALRVQEAGSAYVRSLAALEALMRDEGSGSESVVQQGREAAVTTLLAAAFSVSRLDPADPLTPLLTQILEERVGPRPASDRVQQTIWF